MQKRNIPAKVFFQRYLVHSHLSFLPFWHGWHIIWTDRAAFTWAKIGPLGMVFAVSSVVFGLMGFGENNVRYLFPKIGSILGGIMVALWVFVVLIGI